MKLPDRFGRLPLRAWLTALYGFAFFVAGAILVALMYGVVALELDREKSVVPVLREPTIIVGPSTPAGELEPLTDDVLERIEAAEQRRRDETLNNFLRKSLIGLGVVGAFACVLGYVVAGRALRPLTHITATARRVADRSLHERIDLDGPADEIKELADTFDEMLARLDRSFSGQRHFVGNASHELRTPLAIERTLLEVAMGDPEASADLKAVGKTLLEVNARSERLIEALLTLASTENEISERRENDLQELAATALKTCAEELTDKGVAVDQRLQPAPVIGDPGLLQQLVLNLVQNAIRHNTEDAGELWVTTSSDGDEAILEVSNTGQPVAEHDLERMFEPFVRLSRERTGTSHGLGLSIVRSVAHSHGGSVSAQARDGGGLTVTVRLPVQPLGRP